MSAMPEISDLPTDFMVYVVLYFVVLPIVATGLLAVIRPAGAPSPFGPRPRPKSIASAVLTVYRKTFMWRSRAGRSEFWWYMLFVVTVQNGIAFALATRDHRVDQTLYYIVLAVFLPTGLAAGTRRLHDIGRSGWWQLLALTGIGYLTLIVLWLLPSQKDGDMQVADMFE